MRRTLELLRSNDIPMLYVFSDGAADEYAEEDVKSVRAQIRQVDWVPKKCIVEHPANLGLNNAVTSGISSVLDEHEACIVVEDDVWVNPEFYAYMSASLRRYEGESNVAAVTAMQFPFPRGCLKHYKHDAFFTPRFSPWGWGTWRRYWQNLDLDGARVAAEWKARDMNPRRGGKDVEELVEHHVLDPKGRSWDVLLMARILLSNDVVLWPKWNMVENGGLSEGTHFSRPPEWVLERESPPKSIGDLSFPGICVLEESANRCFRKFFNRYYPSGLRFLVIRIRRALTLRLRSAVSFIGAWERR